MDGLLGWLNGFQKLPKQLFLVHGEPEAKIDFAARPSKRRSGYDAVPVNANAEYELEESGGVVNMEGSHGRGSRREERSTKPVNNLYNVRRRLEDIIYNANLSVDKERIPEKLARINNIILELEKSAINLGSAISESDESENVELTGGTSIAAAQRKREEKTARSSEKKRKRKNCKDSKRKSGNLT